VRFKNKRTRNRRGGKPPPRAYGARVKCEKIQSAIYHSPYFRKKEWLNVPDTKELIFYVEDEKDVAEMVMLYLQKEGYTIHHFFNGEDFLETLPSRIPDLILLDLMLPGIDGLDLCRYLKRDPRLKSIPIIMLTAKDDPIDVVLGLETGTDDYISKPFHPRELLARIKAVLRRHSQVVVTNEHLFKVGPLIFHADALTLQIGDVLIPLSWREYRILELFAKNQGKIISRDQILNAIWGTDEFITDRTVDVYIANIRKKLGDYRDQIVTIREVGYKLDIKK